MNLLSKRSKPYNGLNATLCFFLFLIMQGAKGQCWSFSLSEPSVLDQSMFPSSDRGYFPDGNISVLQQGGEYYAFWSMYRNYRSMAESPLLQNHVGQLSPSSAVFGGREPDTGSSNGFNDGGMWLIGVSDLKDGRLAGFFHAESHWYPRTTQGWKAYKSIGVAYSEDNGLTWGAPVPILKHLENKPETPSWSGLGDGCVIYNHLKNRYYCYYTPASGSTTISMAVSSVPDGAPGSWYKWYNGEFSQPGIGGLQTPVAELSSRPGANPSVHWNTYLNRFVMVWHGWDGKIYISTSEEGEVWETPQLLIDEGSKTWYPVVVGDDSVQGGQTVTLYYARNFQSDGRRTMSYRTLTFSKPSEVGETVVPHLEDGRYAVKNISGSMHLSALNSGAHEAVLEAPELNMLQRWEITHLGNNEYRFAQSCCNRVLDIQDSQCLNTSQVAGQIPNSESTSQIWIIDKLTDGDYVIRPKNCLSQALSRADLTSDKVVTLDYDPCNILQRWTFISGEFSLPVTNFSLKITNESCEGGNNGIIEINAVKNLNYTVHIKGEGYDHTDTFTTSLVRSNLKPGLYKVCFSTQEQSDYKQCFNVTIRNAGN